MGIVPEKKVIEVEEYEYRHLLAISERMSILYDYIEAEKYIDNDTIRLIIGMDRMVKKDGNTL